MMEHVCSTVWSSQLSCWTADMLSFCSLFFILRLWHCLCHRLSVGLVPILRLVALVKLSLLELHQEARKF